MSNSENYDNPAMEAGRKRGNVPSLVEKFVIRLPSGLRTKIKQLSEQNRRSMNSEIIMVLEKHIQQSMLDNNMSDSNLEELESLSRELREEVGEARAEAGEGTTRRLTDKQLTEKLESLPPEKKEALLELLG